MCRIGDLLGLALLCGFVSGFALNSKKWDIMEFLETDVGFQQMESPLIFERTLTAEDAQSKLSRVARQASDDEMEVSPKIRKFRRSICCIRDAKQFSLNETRFIVKCTEQTKPQQAALKWTVKQAVCFLDCVAKEAEVADAGGYLDPEKTTTLVKAMDRWGQLFADKDDLISRCVTFANSFSKERGAVKFEGRKCNMASAVIANCIRSLVEINCPEDRKVASAKCDEHRQILTEVFDMLNV